MSRLGMEIEATITLQDSTGLWHTVPVADTSHCEVCDLVALVDDLDRLTGEQVNACPACRKLARECEGCGREYLTAAAFDGYEEEANIHQDRNGAWLCDSCMAEGKEQSRWDAAHMRRKQMQEEGI